MELDTYEKTCERFVWVSCATAFEILSVSHQTVYFTILQFPVVCICSYESTREREEQGFDLLIS